MGRVKQLWMDQVEEEIEQYLKNHPGVDDEEAHNVVMAKYEDPRS